MSEPTSDNERMARMLGAMADIDPTFTPFLGGLMGMFNASPWPAELSRYVFGPLVFHCDKATQSSGGNKEIGWLTTDLLQKYSPRIYVERLELARGERPDLVSPTELWMAMYNAVMTAPLLHPLSDIYCWAVHRSMVAGGFSDQEKLEKHRKDCVKITDDDVFGDDNWTISHAYKDMAREIRQKVSSQSEYRVGPPRKMKPWTVRAE